MFRHGQLLRHAPDSYLALAVFGFVCMGTRIDVPFLHSLQISVIIHSLTGEDRRMQPGVYRHTPLLFEGTFIGLSVSSLFDTAWKDFGKTGASAGQGFLSDRLFG